MVDGLGDEAELAAGGGEVLADVVGGFEVFDLDAGGAEFGGWGGVVFVAAGVGGEKLDAGGGDLGGVVIMGEW